jgi:hypothetical protein
VVDVGLKNILVDGKYDINGKVLLLPIRGSGPMHGNFSDCLGMYAKFCSILIQERSIPNTAFINI